VKKPSLLFFRKGFSQSLRKVHAEYRKEVSQRTQSLKLKKAKINQRYFYFEERQNRLCALCVFLHFFFA